MADIYKKIYLIRKYLYQSFKVLYLKRNSLTLKTFQKKNNLILLNINNQSYLDETIQMMKENYICFINHDEVYNYSDLPRKFNKTSIDEYISFLNTKKIECKTFSNFENFFSFFEKSEFSKVFTFYPSIGYELDFLNSQFKKFGVNLNFIYDEFDKLCWKHASSGFFKFKTKIPDFVSQIN